MDGEERDATIISRLTLTETRLKDHARDQLRRMATKSDKIFTTPNETSSVAISAESAGLKKKLQYSRLDAEKCDRSGGKHAEGCLALPAKCA